MWPPNVWSEGCFSNLNLNICKCFHSQEEVVVTDFAVQPDSENVFGMLYERVENILQRWTVDFIENFKYNKEHTVYHDINPLYVLVGPRVYKVK